MTPAFLKWRAEILIARIAEGKGHNTVDCENKKKGEWKDSDDPRKRI